MRLLPAILPLLALAPLGRADEQPLPPDVAAMHPEGKWKIRMRDFYRYLVEYYARIPAAQPLLPDYMQNRLVEAEATRRKIIVTRKELDDWIENLDQQIRKATGGLRTLAQHLEIQDMSMAEFRRRSRIAVLRERVARAIMLESDSTRDPNAVVPEETVVFVINRLVQKAKTVYDRKQLPEGVIAKIDDVEITDYQFGRELAVALPVADRAEAIRGMILVEEVNLLLGEGKPSDEDFELQRSWFMDYQKNRLRQLAAAQGAQQEITDKLVAEVVAKRGLTLQQVFTNPAFLAQARARGHFRRSITDDDVAKYYEDNKERFGDQLKVARILVTARAQRQIAQAGRQIRTLEQGKSLADAIWIKVTEGADFADVARKQSEDPDALRRNGGELPVWLTADTPGYQLTWQHANAMQNGGISKPFFDTGRGYVIVKLLDRKKALTLEADGDRIRAEAANARFHHWRLKVVTDALKSPTLVDPRASAASFDDR